MIELTVLGIILGLVLAVLLFKKVPPREPDDLHRGDELDQWMDQ